MFLFQTPRNCSGQIPRNDKLVGTIPYKEAAIVTCSGCQLSASIGVRIYRNKTVAFIGTENGELAKVSCVCVHVTPFIINVIKLPNAVWSRGVLLYCCVIGLQYNY